MLLGVNISQPTGRAGSETFREVWRQGKKKDRNFEKKDDLPELATMMTIRVSRSVYRLQGCGKSRSPCLSLFFHPRQMSSDAIAKLPSPLKDLVAASVADNSVSSGTKPEVDEWIERVASGQVGKAESIKVRLRRRFGHGHVLTTLARTLGP